MFIHKQISYYLTVKWTARGARADHGYDIVACVHPIPFYTIHHTAVIAAIWLDPSFLAMISLQYSQYKPETHTNLCSSFFSEFALLLKRNKKTEEI